MSKFDITHQTAHLDNLYGYVMKLFSLSIAVNLNMGILKHCIGEKTSGHYLTTPKAVVPKLSDIITLHHC